ncbi:acetyl-CoA carboxylase biotin carboxyl carrier protein [Staphylococcus intermedius]|uniref:Acetyl-CoA carboxylase, biotin carboxyl carrier protein n=1 Tax=Staphylococcus intermedius NCTC 11048 TaxID=1141106 RepID=A0A380G688_STAIN|nr:biotin/lipoyl-containing protein [Staphylococcus intermedius]PCF64760.1 acetyl-CoA carboxylase biotin carboxyl carrier protein subunit [Staphylococcus intermedius]PCF80370.1 acetyl-CoA carboxylase biotin carboxyl carrier protein subunit [Staphylococcus intermedius]PCF81720.1 acetyl-CoA carboxylase biotin carboxyl carrier protein subunit [Staphylococcus intermedius]PCF88058.1 acetyl-CoA carboxylase biotin carboxyl carrier protein subunit [Staphylococcus intermedius]PCF88771.1 acetyl-CoA carb
MDLKQIEQTLNLLKQYGAKHFKYRDDEMELELDLSSIQQTGIPVHDQQIAQPSNNDGEEAQQPTELSEDASKVIRSQMIGTFYLQDEKELTKPAVKVGDKVNKGDIIGYIEAMKVMNEVTADVSGEVTEVHVGHGENIEFNQVILTLK